MCSFFFFFDSFYFVFSLVYLVWLLGLSLDLGLLEVEGSQMDGKTNECVCALVIMTY